MIMKSVYESVYERETDPTSYQVKCKSVYGVCIEDLLYLCDLVKGWTLRQSNLAPEALKKW